MAPVGAASRRRHIEAGRTRLAGWPGNEASLDVRVFDQGSRQCGGVSTDPGNVPFEPVPFRGPSGRRGTSGSRGCRTRIKCGDENGSMDGSASAAVPGDRIPRCAEPGVASESPQGAPGVRRASENPKGFSVRDSRQTDGSAGAAGRGRRLRRRQVAATHSALGRSEGAVAQPRPATAEGLPGGPGARSFGGMAEGAEPSPGSSRPRLPWLSPARNAALVQADKQLDRLVRRQKSPLLRDELTAAVGLVRRAERDALRADRLLTISREEAPGDAEWRELYFLHYRNEHEMDSCRTELEERSRRLALGFCSRPAQLNPIYRLMERLDDVHCYYQSAGTPWIGVADRVEATLPTGPGEKVAVRSLFLPGKVLGAHFIGGYPSDEGAYRRSGTRHFHLPGLALTGLVDNLGRWLFAGLRHDIFHANELSAERLAQLSDEELEALIGDWRIQPTEPGASRQAQAQKDCRALRASSAGAESLAMALQCKARDSMLAEAAVASLILYPERFRRALDGESVAVDFFSIALLTPGDVEMWSGQHERFHRYADSNTEPIRVLVYDQQGRPSQVSVRIQVRQFLLSAAEERDNLGQLQGERLAESVTRLLGPMDSAQVGGDVKAKLDAFNQAVRDARRQHVEKSVACYRFEQECGVDHPIMFLTRQELKKEDRYYELAIRSMRTLEETAKELKAMWARQGDWPAGVDAHRKVAARLALLGGLMDEIPLLSCAGGKDLTANLDSEVKFLATAANSEANRKNVHLSAEDLDTDAWRKARAAFERGHRKPEMT